MRETEDAPEEDGPKEDGPSSPVSTAGTGDPERAYTRLLRIVDIGQHFPDRLPREFSRPYAVTAADWSDGRRMPQKKYLDRQRNLRRATNRLQLFLPELLGGPAKKVLELSTAHGAVLEVLRHCGHDVEGTDFANMVAGEAPDARALYRSLNDDTFRRETDDYGLPIPSDGQLTDWPYRPIIESIGIPMRLFDAGRTPYPVDDKSFDYVISLQAIEHYCHPRDWFGVVDEMCRIARQGVFILLNPLVPTLAADHVYAAAFHGFRTGMRDFDRGGFRCVGCHIHWGQALGFKLLRI